MAEQPDSSVTGKGDGGSNPFSPIVGVGVANYRSFDATGFALTSLAKLNILIGRNNAGKSNVLRALRLLGKISGPKQVLDLDQLTDRYRRKDEPPSVTVTLRTDALLTAPLVHVIQTNASISDTITVRWNTNSGEIDDSDLFPEVLDRFIHQIHHELTNATFNGPASRAQYLSSIKNVIVTRAISNLQPFKKLIQIDSFRQIRGDEPSSSAEDMVSGRNIINMLRSAQNPIMGRETELEKFDLLQRFVRNLLGLKKFKLVVPHTGSQILLEMHGNRLPLESYGTGVHQLVLLCANLAMYSGYVVCIEEPEIHIHPELQRKFLRFLADDTDNIYFITTHSNVFLDTLPDVVVHHVTYDGTATRVEHVTAPSETRTVLADMGYRASDLLQANGVIWVEGPSDRIYLKKWISMIDSELYEDTHFAIMFYGGKLLAHLTVSDEPMDGLIHVLRINTNAVCVIDSDRRSARRRLNATKKRIVSELGNDKCWVTKGREIENYLSPRLLAAYIKEKLDVDISLDECDRFQPVDDAIRTALAKACAPRASQAFKFSSRKVHHARTLCKQMGETDLDVLDLRKRIKCIVEHIRRWNSPLGSATPTDS